MADINVWLALSDKRHGHSAAAWQWFHGMRDGDILKPSWGKGLKAAWEVYDGWQWDRHVRFCAEPENVEMQCRMVTERLGHSSAPKALADCYLLAMSQMASATLVTFDAALHRLARDMHQAAIRLP